LVDGLKNNKSIIVVGALAYDQIASTRIEFTGAGPWLNCKLDSLGEHFGGCGGNITYGIGKLSHPAKLISVCGELDFHDYRLHLDSEYIDLQGIMTKFDAKCARAFVVSDPNGEQFTAFYPGPEIGEESWEAHLNNQDLLQSQVMVCAPFPEKLMLGSLKSMTTANPDALRIWCPGQYADSITAGSLNDFTDLWDVLIGNEHEIDHLKSLDPEITNKKTVVVTAGPRPIKVYMAHGGTRTFPVAKLDTPRTDPTGSGDAFVAGFASVIGDHIDPDNKGAWIGHINEAVKYGIRSAQRCLAHLGSQNYTVPPT
jgi:sugar/nucleoside kinase (ribokinase family)